MKCNNNKAIVGCNCTYEPCSRKHNCCECVRYHRQNGEYPACFFTKEGELSYDRSFENLQKHHI
ncbi:MAG: DUF6485 family protein [Pseudomonadota bacterium]